MAPEESVKSEIKKRTQRKGPRMTHKKKNKQGRASEISGEEAHVLESILSGEKEYHVLIEGDEDFYELEDVDDAPFSDTCDLCEGGPAPGRRWYKSTVEVGLDICSDCYETMEAPHPHPLVRRPVGADAGGGRDLQLLEGVWACRMHPRKLSLLAGCEEDAIAPWLTRLLEPHGQMGAPVSEALNLPMLGLTEVEDGAPQPQEQQSATKTEKAARAEKQAMQFFKGFQIDDAIGNERAWERAAKEASALLECSGEAAMANGMEYELPPLRSGQPWKHAPHPKLGSAKYASTCEKLDQLVGEAAAAPVDLNAELSAITFTPCCNSLV